MMMAPVPAKTSPNVPTNSAANRCNAVMCLLTHKRLTSAEIPIEHLRGEHGAVLSRGEVFGDDQQSICLRQRTQHARPLSAGDASHVPLRDYFDRHAHVVPAATTVLDTPFK